MSIRRRIDPSKAIRIWDTIKITLNQRNLPTYDRIARHLARVYTISEQSAQDELSSALLDGLLLKTLPGKCGTEQAILSLPTETIDNDTYDWYCCECHKAGKVDCCQQCHRVFHLECHKPEDTGKKICSFCEKINSDTFADREELNKILGYMCGHLKAKLPAEITNRQIVEDNTSPVVPPGGLAGPTWISEGEDSWRPGILIKNHMDLAMMDAKTRRKEYKNLAEFQAEAHNILHNIVIYHGEQSIVGEMGLRMYEDCCYDLQEIRRCSDCYRLSNEKGEKMWFCKPCNPPHKLVYAKQKGYPYWPAKVMQILKGNVYDVRFFGGQHLRANISEEFIRQINVNLKSLQIKKSNAWNKAYDELKHHQALLQKLGKRKNSDTNSMNLKEKKIRKLEKSNTKEVPNFPLKKQLLKDLRVKVERISSEGSSDQSEKEDKDEKDNLSSKVIKKKTPELHLPVVHENAGEISTTFPQGMKKEGSQEDMVTSSSQEPRTKCVLIQTEQVQSDVFPGKVKRERRTSDQHGLIDKMRQELRQEMEKEKCREIENLQAEHAKQVRQLKERHQQLVSEIKKKQWCYNCETEAIYHCCWNTAYCSTECQQLHWQREHKRVCRRKR
ncbi:zinc finger MYND domain-containing protein 11 [Leptopilina heterotoma]|uniref:zinc finger MYND domain-containing protein 11 n=1 Tax=Leptopilina heterotoma TaxID=63436 RepID=UPI001CA92AD9|nr:zinc finger MYND domain-containing protein 11 [Leptopilina heterotoma]